MSSDTPLSTETLALIVNRFGARADTVPCGARRYPLFDCSAFAVVERGDRQGEGMAIDLVDLGLGGLGFRTRGPIRQGEILRVILTIPGLPLQVWPCRVTDVHFFDGREYSAGAQFEPGQTPKATC